VTHLLLWDALVFAASVTHTTPHQTERTVAKWFQESCTSLFLNTNVPTPRTLPGGTFSPSRDSAIVCDCGQVKLDGD